MLLALAVALAASLTVAGGTTLGLYRRSLEQSLGQIVGLMDLQVQHRFAGRFDAAVLDQVRRWPGVAAASGRFETGVTLQHPIDRVYANAVAVGIEPGVDAQLNPHQYLEGGPITGAGQIVIDESLRDKLEARVGDKLRVVTLGRSLKRTWRVVGIMQRPKLFVLQQTIGLVNIDEVRAVAGIDDQLNQIDIQLHDGVDAEQFESEYADALPSDTTFHIAAAVSSGLKRRLTGMRMMMVAIMTVLFASAGLLILTSLTTAVMQRQRELAVLRCIGTARWQIAASQIFAGAMLSGGGALLGTPLGLVIAYWYYMTRYRSHAGTSSAAFMPDVTSIVITIGAALLVGALSSAYPAFLAARVRPLRALAARGRPPGVMPIVLCLVVGVVGIAVQPMAWTTSFTAEQLFWFYIAAGLPLLFVGYFLLSAPVFALVARLAAPLVTGVLRLPRDLLSQTVLATPMRYGFTGGAMMIGLAMLVAIWSTGQSIFDEYITKRHMPDAFAHSFFAMTPTQEQGIRDADAVTAACATTMFPVEALELRLALKSLTPSKTHFVSLEPEAFFEIVDLEWVQGDPRRALDRLKDGRALLVARQFFVSHGVGVGSKITLMTRQGPVMFEVVGVVASPGLEVAVHYFGIGRNYVSEAMGSIFGTRQDAEKYFGVDDSNLMLMSLRDDVSDANALEQIRKAAPGVGAGSSRTIRKEIADQVRHSLNDISKIAVGCLLIACVGVGHLIVANIAARRYEYGVLRAIGTPRGALGRLIVGETLLVVVTGCIIGTALGLETAWLNQIMRARLFGFTYELRPHVGVIVWGWLTVTGLALAAVAPAVWRLVCTQPRTLLAAGAEA